MPRRATRDELSTLATVLAEAFQDYPWTRWTVPADQHRERVEALQRIYLEELALPNGMVWTTDSLDAVAAFIPALMPSPASKTLDSITALHADRFEALSEAEALLAPHRPDHDWVLATVGVAPQTKGRGLGTAVVAAGLAVLDAQAATCITETSDPDNLPFYHRLGFEAITRIATPGPPVWILVRPAQSAGDSISS